MKLQRGRERCPSSDKRLTKANRKPILINWWAKEKKERRKKGGRRIKKKNRKWFKLSGFRLSRSQNQTTADCHHTKITQWNIQEKLLLEMWLGKPKENLWLHFRGRLHTLYRRWREQVDCYHYAICGFYGGEMVLLFACSVYGRGKSFLVRSF